MRFSFTIKSNKFPEAPGLMKRAVGAGFAAAAPTLLADMKRRTPVDTGDLRASETATSDDESLTLAAGNASVDYAVYVHQGTRRMSARPFMRDAIEAGEATIVNAITAAAEGAFR